MPTHAIGAGILGIPLSLDGSAAGTTQQSTFALNSAGARLDFLYIPVETKTVNKVRFRHTAVGGTLGATDLELTIRTDDASMQPGSVVSGGTTTTVTAVPSGAGWVEFTGLTANLTAGTRYWFELRNANGVPGTNFPTFRTGASATTATNGLMQVGAQQNTTSIRHSMHARATFNGSVWTFAAQCLPGPYRLEFSDGTFDGVPWQGLNAEGTDAVYSSREVGSLFTMPANGSPARVRGLWMPVDKTGTPTGSLRMRIYEGTTLLATSHTISVPAQVTTTVFGFLGLFTTPVVLHPGRTYRAVLSETTNGDAATNRFEAVSIDWENNSNSIGLVPYSAQKTYFNGTSWTETPQTIVPFGLVLDENLPIQKPFQFI